VTCPGRPGGQLPRPARRLAGRPGGWPPGGRRERAGL